MNLHEYQAKEILSRVGVPTTEGEVATTPEEAQAIAARLGGGGRGAIAIKAQVHTGGRGKAGGVKLAHSATEARAVAAQILGMQIKGLTVHKVLDARAAEIAHEAYAGVIIDRVSKRAVFMVSPAGGIDIEDVAATKPDRIQR